MITRELAKLATVVPINDSSLNKENCEKYFGKHKKCIQKFNVILM